MLKKTVALASVLIWIGASEFWENAFFSPCFPGEKLNFLHFPCVFVLVCCFVSYLASVLSCNSYLLLLNKQLKICFNICVLEKADLSQYVMCLLGMFTSPGFYGHLIYSISFLCIVETAMKQNMFWLLLSVFQIFIFFTY